MSGIFSGAMAAGLLATVAMVAAGHEGASSQAMAQDARWASQSYRLQLAGDAHFCLVERGSLDMRGNAEVRMNSGCEGIYSSLANARFWTERAGGDVALTSDDGTVLIEFAVSDGAAYVTFQPGAPLASLIALN